MKNRFFKIIWILIYCLNLILFLQFPVLQATVFAEETEQTDFVTILCGNGETTQIENHVFQSRFGTSYCKELYDAKHLVMQDKNNGVVFIPTGPAAGSAYYDIYITKNAGKTWSKLPSYFQVANSLMAIFALEERIIIFNHVAAGVSISVQEFFLKENNTYFKTKLTHWSEERIPSNVIYARENTFRILFTDGTETTYTLPQQTVGVCGEDAVWELQDNGTLVISGSGAMTDYSTSNPAPWQHLREEITAVTVEQGIAHIGANAFQACSQLQAVMIANSVTDIGQAAFAACDQLNLIHYMNGTKTDWQQITIADQNDSLLQTELCCQYDNQAYLYPFLSCHRGDTNGDNNIAVEDAVEILTAYAERAAGLPISLSAYQEKAADVDGDGQITVEDAVYTLTYYAKKSAGMTTSWKDAGVFWSSPLAGYTAYDLMSVSRSDFLSGVDWNFVETGAGTKSPLFFGYTISYYDAYYGYTDFTAEKIQYPKSIRIEYGNITANTQVGMSYSELIATLGEPTYYSYSGENGKDIISYEMEHMRISLFLDSHTVSEGMAGDCSEIDQEAAAERVAAQNPSIYSAYIVSTNR